MNVIYLYLNKIKNNLSKYLSNFKFFIFFDRNDFKSFYVKTVKSKLKNKKNHPTLGKNISENGIGLFNNIKKKLKINKNSIVVDYGCGSLRVGQHFIKYLNPCKYIGLDITHFFFTEGFKRIDKKLLVKKHPEFHVISDKTLNLIKKKK